jgi:NADPH:quinone reductase-like Zn-dependent oxidoreductase
MKALIRDRYGPPDVLDVRDVARPVPKDDQVLVRVHAASINDWDWGLLHEPTFPIFGRGGTPRVRILGSDIAGRVAEVGNRVQRFKPGDEVFGDLSAYGGWGGFAEYVCASEKRLAPKPARMTFEQAAALPQAGQLAVQAIFTAGPLRAGQKILINGAGGGVGTIGIQLAKMHDVDVTGVDSELKHEMMRRIGFDHVIDYTKEDFTRDGRRYDLIVDTKTTRSAADYARALNPGGTYATVGGPSIATLFKIPLEGLWFRLAERKTLRLVGLRTNRDLPYLCERFEAGQLLPVIDGPYSLNEAREAFRRFGAGRQMGKIVITISHEGHEI